MIQLNPQYEAIFDEWNIDQDCDMIATDIDIDEMFKIVQDTSDRCYLHS